MTEKPMRKMMAGILGLWLAASPAFGASSPAEIQEEVFPKFDKGIEQMATRQNVDERSLMEKLTFRDPKFQRIIQDCFEIMADSSLVDLLSLQDEVNAEIRKKQEKMGKLARESITAPSSSWNPLATTQESISRDIAGLRQDIADLEASINTEKTRVYNDMVQNGVPIEREQFEFMINAADAMETAKIMAVAENLKYMLQNMEEKVSDPNAPVDLHKIYSGMYMMCHRVYMYAISFAVEQIDNIYKPRLLAMKEKNDKLIADSRSLSRQVHTPADRATLESNMASQKRMSEVINLYTRYLDSQKKNLVSLNNDMTKRYRVAENTYQTIRLSSELLSLLRNSQTDFSRIFAFRPPELQLLHDARFSREFAEVTANLRME